MMRVFFLSIRTDIHMADAEQARPVSIELRENGPLIVRGLTRLVSHEGKEFEVKETFALCRCGGSANKPFCDGTHKVNGFSGARQTERSVHASKAYVGERIAIHDNRTICAHATTCTADLPGVFKYGGRPWIDPDGGTVEEIVSLIRRCPSGALSYTIDGTKHDDFGREPEIAVEKGGPYRVVGHIGLGIDESLSPPAPEHYALCRCGQSKNKPYCDGSHHHIEAGWDS